MHFTTHTRNVILPETPVQSASLGYMEYIEYIPRLNYIEGSRLPSSPPSHPARAVEPLESPVPLPAAAHCVCSLRSLSLGQPDCSAAS